MSNTSRISQRERLSTSDWQRAGTPLAAIRFPLGREPAGLTGGRQVPPSHLSFLAPSQLLSHLWSLISPKKRQPGWIKAAGWLCDGDQWFPDTGLRGHQIDFTGEQIQIWTQFFRGERELLISVTLSLEPKRSPFWPCRAAHISWKWASLPAGSCFSLGWILYCTSWREQKATGQWAAAGNHGDRCFLPLQVNEAVKTGAELGCGKRNLPRGNTPPFSHQHHTGPKQLW